MITSQEAPALLREFLIYMETIRGKSEKTVSEYFFDLRMFFRFLKIHRGLVDEKTPMEEISILDVDLPLISSVVLMDLYEYMNYLHSVRKLSPRSRARKVASLRSFFKYLSVKVKVISEDPAKYLDSPKLKKTLPSYLTLEESQKLLHSIEGPYKERDFAIITLFLNCGLRVSELVGIDLSHQKEDSLVVTGKGNKERMIYLNPACQSALAAYLPLRSSLVGKEKEALFLSRNKTRISIKTVQWLVKKHLSEAGIDPSRYSVHKLRHTAATLMYQHGKVDIRTLQEVLGHEQLSTTEIYTHISDENLKQATMQNPLAKEGQK